MTDKELIRIYAEAVAENFTDSGIRNGLRAVFLAGARAQRAMEPTSKMLEASIAGLSFPQDYSVDYQGRAIARHSEIFRAMQHADAPSCAWGQAFAWGSQLLNALSWELRARAVRRVPVEERSRG